MVSNKNEFSLAEKTELFLELFGNIQVRAQSLDYVEKMATEFIRYELDFFYILCDTFSLYYLMSRESKFVFCRMVTDFDYLEQKLPTLDLSNLKVRKLGINLH